MNKEIKFNGIVLNSKDYKDYDKVITVFSPEIGKSQFLLKGCKRPKAKLRYASQPFFYGEFVSVEGKGYDVITQVSAKNNFFNITANYEAYVDACSVLKSVNMSCLSQNSERLFLLLISYLIVLDQNLDKSDLLACKFCIELLKLTGFEINLDICQECGQNLNDNIYYNINQNSMVCENCRSYDAIHIDIEMKKTIEIIKNNKFLELIKINFDNVNIKGLKMMFFSSIDRLFK